MPSSAASGSNGSASYARSPINLRRTPRTCRDARVSRTKLTSYGPAHETWKARPAPVASATAMTLLPSPGFAYPTQGPPSSRSRRSRRCSTRTGRSRLVPTSPEQAPPGRLGVRRFRPIPENGGGRSGTRATLGQVRPLRAGARAPEEAVQDGAGIPAGTAVAVGPLERLGKVRRMNRPLLVGEIHPSVVADNVPSRSVELTSGPVVLQRAA